MTTNELKCFCGAVVVKHYNLKQELIMLSCKNPDCFMNSDLHPEMFRERQCQIKSVINKAKAAAVQVAVQQERERVIHYIKLNERVIGEILPTVAMPIEAIHGAQAILQGLIIKLQEPQNDN